MAEEKETGAHGGDIQAIRALVDLQAEDEGLWFQARTAPEAYLQAELRKLHDAIERAALPEAKPEGPTLGDALKVVFMTAFRAGELYERSQHFTSGPEEAWARFMAEKAEAHHG